MREKCSFLEGITWTDRQTDRQAGRQADRQAGRQTEGWTDIETYHVRTAWLIVWGTP